ncbi:MAG: 1-acyl-sn-glycerol-3-phosphate acyltransferase [Leptospira sp.]|nr:1-acyl-sn-glycerol-3-phosphate acyltransferase [Leptospira sp.]
MSKLSLYVVLCYFIPVILPHFPIGLTLSYFLKITKHDQASNRINNYLAYLWLRVFLFLTGRKLEFDLGDWKPENKKRFLICNHTNSLEVPLIVSLPYLSKSKDVNLSYLGGDIIQRYKIIPLMMHSRIVEAVIYSEIKPDFRNFKKNVLDVLNRRSIFLYPEGRRTFTEDIQPFETGVMKIAYKYNIDLDVFVVSGMMSFSSDPKFIQPNHNKKILFHYCGTIKSNDHQDFDSYLHTAENLMINKKKELDHMLFN